MRRELRFLKISSMREICLQCKVKKTSQNQSENLRTKPQIYKTE